LAVIGVDSGKKVVHSVGLTADGKIALRRKIKRPGLKDVFEPPPWIVGMKADLCAHFVTRTLRALGRQPRIISAIDTEPFAKGQKNNCRNAEAVVRASLWPSFSFRPFDRINAFLDLAAQLRGHFASLQKAVVGTPADAVISALAWKRNIHDRARV
jgi:hypothetical protein